MKLKTTAIALALFSGTTWAQVQWESRNYVPSAAIADSSTGAAVAIDGGIGIVGTRAHPTLDGKAYLFDVSTGQEFFVLNGNDETTGERFGNSVAIHGNRAVVGAPEHVHHGIESGAVYVFDVTTGQELAELFPNDPTPIQEFGYSVAIDGNTLVVGAKRDSTQTIASGAVYVFDLNTLQQLAKLYPSAPTPYMEFGTSVALDGSNLLIGGPSFSGTSNAQGTAFLFDLASGQQIVQYTASDGHASDRFGEAVSIHGSTALIGASRHTETWPNAGAAYAFDVSTGQELAKFTRPGGGNHFWFGAAVAVQGNKALIGCPGDKSFDLFAGAAYLFMVDEPAHLMKLLSSSAASGQNLGESVAFADDVAIVGKPGDEHSGNNSGSVDLFDISDHNTGGPYCFGDGSGTACPCGANGASGAGCLNTTGVGVQLSGHGDAQFSNDNLFLLATGVPPSKFGLVLRGSVQLGGAQVATVGDGLLCVGGQTARSQLQLSTPIGKSFFVEINGSPLGAWTFGAGATTNYQYWYRDQSNTCSGAGFNFSNAWSVTWVQ